MTAALARVLGLEPAEARALVAQLLQRRGRFPVAVRALALLVGVSRPARALLPRSIRLRAVRPLVYELLRTPAENMLYVRREKRG
jgi:hypothetical protein